MFKLILVLYGWGISSKNAFRWMSLAPTYYESTLVQVMAWCHQATSHYLSQCWHRSLSPYAVTRPQWVNTDMLDENAMMSEQIKTWPDKMWEENNLYIAQWNTNVREKNCVRKISYCTSTSDFNGLMQERRNSISNALELLTHQSIVTWIMREVYLCWSLKFLSIMNMNYRLVSNMRRVL